MKRLLLDQGLPRSAVRLLSDAGWDVRHVSEIGLSRATDAEILATARADRRVCVTLDADFHALLATSGDCEPSVVRIRREGLDAIALAALIETVWPRIADALDTGAMVTVTDRAIRVRSLPIVRT